MIGRVVALNGGRHPMKVGYCYNPLRDPYREGAIEAVIEWKYRVGQLVELTPDAISLSSDSRLDTRLALIVECYWELPDNAYYGLTSGMKYTIPPETTQEDFQRMAQWTECFRYKVQICGESEITTVRESTILGVVS